MSIDIAWEPGFTKKFMALHISCDFCGYSEHYQPPDGPMTLRDFTVRFTQDLGWVFKKKKTESNQQYNHFCCRDCYQKSLVKELKKGMHANNDTPYLFDPEDLSPDVTPETDDDLNQLKEAQQEEEESYVMDVEEDLNPDIQIKKKQIELMRRLDMATSKAREMLLCNTDRIVDSLDSKEPHLYSRVVNETTEKDVKNLLHALLCIAEMIGRVLDREKPDYNFEDELPF